jgi:hypothetical protein
MRASFDLFTALLWANIGDYESGWPSALQIVAHSHSATVFFRHAVTPNEYNIEPYSSQDASTP